MRRTLFQPLPAGTVVDDFVIPLSAKMRSGCRIVYDAQAVAHEETAPDVAAEFRRRSRIGVGGFQALSILWPLLNPRYGWTAFAFWSHKVMRWLCPFLLIVSFLTSVVLAGHALYRALLFVELAFYAACLAGMVVPAASRFSRVLGICTMFTAMNAALLTGFFRWLRGNSSGIWRRTERGPRDLVEVRSPAR
jgi:cellulose synthase/poly-beta-1,6-N-acetylglucosamine synthase-like glycosyltransferase